MNKNLIIIIIISLTAFNLPAQTNLRWQAAYADSLFASAQYFDAITEYKRLLFFDKENKYSFSGNYKIGLSYKKGGKFDDAIKYFRLAEKNAKRDSGKLKAKFQIIRTNILRGTTEIALNHLRQLAKELNDSLSLKKIRYWKGWAFMFSDKWDSAKAEFTRINPNHELIKICDNVINQKYSVTFAKLFSYILPGAGQFYTGHYLSGLMSLGMNVLWGYFTVKAFIADRVFDGIVTGNLLWFRFYRGNFQNAEKFALQKNIEIANEALRKIQLEYKGEKP